jgi:hypothetical protein
LSQDKGQVHGLATSHQSVKRFGPQARVCALVSMSTHLCCRQVIDRKSLLISLSNCSNDNLSSSRQLFTPDVTCTLGSSPTLRWDAHRSTHRSLPLSNRLVKALHTHAVTVQASTPLNLASDGSEMATLRPSGANRPIEDCSLGTHLHSSLSSLASKPLQNNAEMCLDQLRHR